MAGFNRHDDFEVGERLFVDNENYTSSDSPRSYNVTFSNPLSGTTATGIGIKGIEALISNDLSPNVSITIF